MKILTCFFGTSRQFRTGNLIECSHEISLGALIGEMQRRTETTGKEVGRYWAALGVTRRTPPRIGTSSPGWVPGGESRQPLPDIACPRPIS